MNHRHAHHDHQRHATHDEQAGRPSASQPSPARALNALAFKATLHCLSGCAVGEVLGMVIGTAIGLSDGATIALAVALAFVIAGAAAYPVDRWLISRGKGHAVVHAQHAH